MTKNATDLIQIRGNTYPVKDALRAAGCRWSRDLRCWTARDEQVAERAFKIMGQPFQRGDSVRPPTVGRAATSDRPEIASPTGSTPDAATIFGKKSAVVTEALASLPSGIILSGEQVAIHNWFEKGQGNLVVEALAGTGKTFTITYGFARVVGNVEAVYLVFNKKNQREALSKITDPRVTVLTLNACGYRFCRSVWNDCKPDDEVEFDRVRACLPNIPDEAVTSVNRLVGFLKNLFVGVPTEAQALQTADERGVFCGLQDEDGVDEFPVARLASIALTSMRMALDVRDPAKRISFNDQVWLPVSNGWVRPNYDLVVVDETQDMNLPQLVMVQRMVRAGGRVCVIGDRNQCIYTFRGACPDGMGIMTRELKASTLGLTVTRRCPKVVVKHVLPIVPGYKSADDAPEGEMLTCSEGELFERLAVGDAVLSRSNAPLMPLCLSLLRKGVPARIEGRDIGRQLLGMVRKLKARSVPDFLRRLSHWADKQRRRVDIGKNAAAKVAVVDDQEQTLQALAEGCANVAEIEARINALFQDSDENAKPAVVLSSTHKAKGLEWDRVALLSWTYRRTRKNMTSEQRQEEENIYYVACTRTKKVLTLVHEGGQRREEKN